MNESDRELARRVFLGRPATHGEGVHGDTMLKLLAGLLLGMVTGASAQTGYTIETFTIPGIINIGNINNRGEIVGGLKTPNGDGTYTYAAFVRSPDGSYTTLTPPGTVGQVLGSWINDRGAVVGQYGTGPVTFAGFVYQNGSYRTVSIGNANTDLVSVNNENVIVGGTIALPNTFVLVPGKPLRQPSYPGAGFTAALSTNDLGELVGFYTDLADFDHGFVLFQGKYTTVDYPGVYYTYPAAINNHGIIVGHFNYYLYTIGFVYKDKLFSPFRISGAQTTFLTGINDAGVISGAYVDKNGQTVGFVATPTRNE